MTLRKKCVRIFERFLADGNRLAAFAGRLLLFEAL
jgi:hypothetical protein